jgi:hypothetical protein
MKVYNLQCEAQHQFEGWFASEDDYTRQLQTGLLECPICGDKTVQRLPSAPRLNLGAAAQPTEPVPTPAAQAQQVMMPPEQLRALQAAYLQFARAVVAQTEDVGERFAEEARRIHYGEVAQRGIRGQASREETQALLEEGIAVMPLPLPKGFKGTLQ